ncbi:agarase [Catenovulum agarivorans DS-2]|uniref:Agarase n=1 Tax=Catenovulum agarivorans DS-2 TaxID=1328313 RepID=W7QZE0_9ALTE|nr:Ig-like domain-containing protein [Catenovulum agarivorans]EWH10720.1 agarase [Catenovulum agarivorans DS-2]
MTYYRTKALAITTGLLLSMSAETFAQTQTDINLNVQHSVGGVAEFDRKKFITLHATLSESGWTGEEEKLQYMMDELNVYFGRDNGSIMWNLNQATEDPERPGYVDPTYMATKGKQARINAYGKQLADRHQFDDHNDVMVGGQTSSFWLGRSTKPCCGKEGWEIAGADAIGEYVGHFLNEFYRNDGEDPSMGQARPKLFEVLNEPLYELIDGEADSHVTPLEVFEYHNDVATAVRKFNDSTLIGGYTTAFPIFEERDFARWDERMKLFMDTSGEYMDFFSIHIYDFNNLGNDGKVNFKGGRLEATFDMMEHYSALRLGEVKPLVISEYAGRDHKLEKNYWSSYRDWQSIKAISPLLLSQMDRPNLILKSIPFINVKAIWGTADGIPYNWRLLRQENENADGLSGDWVFSDVVKFYELWSDVEGTRVESRTTNPDVLIDTYVNDNKAYVILSNLNYSPETVYLNLFGENDNNISQIKVKHLHLSGGKVVLDETTQSTSLESFTLDTEATAIIEYTFDSALAINQTAEENKYYAQSYNQQIIANQSIQFNINDVVTSQYGDATLRLGIGRDLDKSRQPIVKVNGVQIDVPTNFSGDDQQNRPAFFSLLEIPVPYNLLTEENTLEVKFNDDGGRVSSAVLQVMNFSADIRAKTSAVTGVAISHHGHFLATGETVQIEGTALPFFANNTQVTFSVDNPAVASISSDGLLTALNPGQVIVTATSVEGGLTAQSTITVEQPAEASFSFDDINKYRTAEYTAGETLDVTTHFEAGTGSTVSDKFGGVQYLLRELTSSWQVVKDIAVTDYSAVGQQRGTSSVNIPLHGVTATENLPEGNFYFLFIRFANTEGVTKTVQLARLNIKPDPNVVPAMLSLDDPSIYQTSSYVANSTLPVTVNFEAGTGETVTNQFGGVQFFLRLIDTSTGSWQVLQDVTISSADAIGQQNGQATANLSLAGLTPTADLPTSQFYFLWARFNSSDGNNYSIGGVSPIEIIEPSIAPSVTFDDPTKYSSTTYLTSGSMDLTTNIEAGSGNVISEKLGGVKVFLRELRPNWTVVKDVIVYDSSVIGEQTVSSTVSIPLGGLTPTHQLPAGNFYFLYVQFASSNGQTYNNGIARLNIDSDFDNDGIGDLLDTDDDNDGTPDATDTFPFDAVYGVLGDFDGDQDIDRKDISFFVRALRNPSLIRPEFDFNGDGKVHQSDVSRLRNLCTRPRCAE